jgi:hypothetical protein
MTEIKTNSPGFANVPLPTLVSALTVAVLAAWGLHAVFITGPAMRAAAHETVERAIADENRQFCEKFGMRSGSDAFTACGKELSVVRQKQADRDSAAAQGIL